jgi:O-antigen/teichoic acid export membrane protein
VLAALVLTFVGRWAVVFLYGEDYAPAAVPLVWISWGIVMMSLYVLLSRDFTARDRQVINVIAAYIALVGNIALNVWLIPRYGILGAAIGTSASYSVAAVLLYGFFLRESGLPWYEPLVLNASDVVRGRRLAAEVTRKVRGSTRAKAPRAPHDEDPQ